MKSASASLRVSAAMSCVALACKRSCSHSFSGFVLNRAVIEIGRSAVTPGVTILVGVALAKLIAPPIGTAANALGLLIIEATNLRPFFMGILVSVIVGVALTLPISSADICAALWVLHSMGAVHRDVKDSNVILRGSDAVLIDFDASRLVKPERPTDTVILGTTGYAAPEQFGMSQTDAADEQHSEEPADMDCADAGLSGHGAACDLSL